MVRSLAKSANLPLVATSVGQWFADSPGHLDSVVKQISEVWATARATCPAIVFIDELDALPNRDTMETRAKDWWTTVITYVLTCLDSAVSGVTKDMIVIGATNHAADLDAALVRPGRLEKVIHVGHPESAADRAGIFRTHLGDQLPGVDLGTVAQMAVGMTGADIMAIVRGARRRARGEGRPLAIEDLVAEMVPPETRSRSDVSRSALHEAGHAVAAFALGLDIELVSIVPGSGCGGAVSYRNALPDLPTRAEIERFVVIILAGAAAEEVVIGSRSSGLGGSERSDIGQATTLIASVHASYGLGDSLTFRALPEQAGRLVPDRSCVTQGRRGGHRASLRRRKESRPRTAVRDRPPVLQPDRREAHDGSRGAGTLPAAP